MSNKPFIYDLNYVKEQSAKNLFTVVSLFAGGGGSSTGYRLAGGKVLAINEFVPAAQDVYAKNYPDTYIFPQDIRELTGEAILKQIGLKRGELDILDGSPPCASFSTAGLREKGWGRVKKYSDLEQRTDDLFFEFVRILEEVQPKVFVAENVRGLTIGTAADLLGSEEVDLFGYWKNTIYHSLVSAGYKVRFKVLDAKYYRVPQSRARTIFIGVRNDIDIKIQYPEGNKNIYSISEATKDLEFSGNTLPMADLDKYKWGLCKPGETFMHMGERIGKKMSGMVKTRLDKDKPCATIMTRAFAYHWNEPRTLTIEECIRASSFPDDYFLGERLNKQWERLGRAVPPLLLKAVAEHIYNTILKPYNEQ
jgi:DNA (cytosine-5)-methyltransferase 1